VLTGPAFDHHGRLGVALGLALEPGRRVVPVGIEARRYQQQLRTERGQCGPDLVLPCAEKERIAAAANERHIEHVAVRAALSGAARSRIVRILVGRRVEHLGVVFETVLRPVAVVDIEVEDGDAANAFGARRHQADRDVVDEAEAHRLRVLGMMAGRAHDREGVFHCSVEDPIHALDHCTGRGPGGPHREGRDVGVRVEITAAAIRRSIEPRHVARTVDAVDHLFRYRRRHLRREAEVRGLDGLEDGACALGPLRVAICPVPDLLRVGEQRDHSNVRVRKRSSSSGAWRSMPAF